MTAGGKVTSTTDTSGRSISTLNPFRYRCYVYDPETGLYYLGSRYYDAEVERFVSADAVANISSKELTLYELNLYVYCDNNPISRFDIEGSFWLFQAAACLVGGVIGAAANTVSTIATQLVTDHEINWKSVAVSAGSGFIAGAIAATPLGKYSQMALGGVINGASYITDCVVNHQEIDVVDLTLSVGIGVFGGAISGEGANKDLVMSHAHQVKVKAVQKYSAKATEKWAAKRIASAAQYSTKIITHQAIIASARFTISCSVVSFIGKAINKLSSNRPIAILD